MDAQPLRGSLPDPAEILHALPERWREQFLNEHRCTLEAARDVWRFHHLRELLRLWQLRAVAYSNPDFENAAQAVRENRTGEFVRTDRLFFRQIDRR